MSTHNVVERDLLLDKFRESANIERSYDPSFLSEIEEEFLEGDIYLPRWDGKSDDLLAYYVTIKHDTWVLIFFKDECIGPISYASYLESDLPRKLIVTAQHLGLNIREEEEDGEEEQRFDCDNCGDIVIHINITDDGAALCDECDECNE